MMLRKCLVGFFLSTIITKGYAKVTDDMIAALSSSGVEKKPCLDSAPLAIVNDRNASANQWCLNCKGDNTWVCKNVEKTVAFIMDKNMAPNFAEIVKNSDVWLVRSRAQVVDVLQDKASTVKYLFVNGVNGQTVEIKDQAIDNLPNLELLDFMNVKLQDSAISKLTILTNLSIVESNLSSLNLQNQLKLTNVIVSRNNLAELAIKSPSIRSIDASLNRFSKFPYEYLDFPTLTYLNLQQNEIKSLEFTSEQKYAKFTALVESGSLLMDTVPSRSCPPNYDPKSLTLTKSTSKATLFSCVISSSTSAGSAISVPTQTTESSSSMSAMTVIAIILGIIALLLITVLVVIRYKRSISILTPHQEDNIEVNVSPSNNLALLTKEDYVNNFSIIADPSMNEIRLPQDQIHLSKSISSDLWKGTFGSERVVLKRIEIQESTSLVIGRFISGVKQISELKHENIVHFYGVSWVSGTDLCAIAEFMELGSLSSVLGSSKLAPQLTWDVRLRMCLDITNGLAYSHLRSEFERPVQLTSGHILVNQNFVCKLDIFDFMAAYRRSITCSQSYGSHLLAYTAPEILQQNQFYGMIPSFSGDVYALGVILCEISSEQKPYANLIRAKGNVGSDIAIAKYWLEKDASNPLPPPHENNAIFFTRPKSFQDIAMKCLIVQPTQRPSAAEVVAVLHNCYEEISKPI